MSLIKEALKKCLRALWKLEHLPGLAKDCPHDEGISRKGIGSEFESARHVEATQVQVFGECLGPVSSKVLAVDVRATFHDVMDALMHAASSRDPEKKACIRAYKSYNAMAKLRALAKHV